MTKKPCDAGSEPVGGRAAERLREFEQQRGLEPASPGSGPDVPGTSGDNVPRPTTDKSKRRRPNRQRRSPEEA